MRTPVSWVGNKTSILRILYAMFPLSYERYIEPFGGSGAVLLGKEKPDKFEVYNDYNQNLVNLFRCMRERPLALIRSLGFLNLNSRDDFNALKQFFEKEQFGDFFVSEEKALSEVLLGEPQAHEMQEMMQKNTLDYDVRRAAMFLKLLRYSYSSSGKSYACQPFNIVNLFQLIEQVGKRLQNVVVENQDFEVLIKHYDRPESFFYLDPPYMETEHFYEVGFGLADHLRLRDTLLSIEGKFLLSYNDCEQVRELYKDCCMFAFKRIHSMAQKYEAGKEFPEILISNYDMFERERVQPKQLSLYEEDL